MVVMILERVPPSLRGELTRWMLELKAGVFVGTISAMVRDKLWEKACKGLRDGGGMLIFSSNTEQGYAIQFFRMPARPIGDFEGLFLVRVPEE